MKIAYFDCFSGISGDMCLGALVDAGVPLRELERRLKAIPVKGYALTAEKVSRSGISATKVDVVLNKGKSGAGTEVRKWKDISGIIRACGLSDEIKKKGQEIFRSLFEAEALAHGKSVAKVHLHELSSVDCIVDIFGTLIGLSLLGVDAVYSSAVNLGGGLVKTDHGLLPVPAPATAGILTNTPVYTSGPPFELTTPTGAAILKAVSRGFGVMPCMQYEKTGHGAGSREIAGRPNVLRVFIGEMYNQAPSKAVTVIETNIDDMNPQIYEFVMERLFEAGAADVFLTQVIMKKSRPGTLLTVLCPAERKDALIDIILRETTTIGVRFYDAGRVTMQRKIKKVKTKYGIAGAKVSAYGRDLTKCIPEYEDCRKLARKTGMSLRDIIAEVGRAAEKKIK